LQGKRGEEGLIIGRFYNREKKRLQGDRLQEKRESIINTDLVINKKKVRVISVYGEQGGKNLEEKMERCIREGEENLIVGGDLNIRLEELRKGGMEIEREGMERCSKDKTRK